MTTPQVELYDMGRCTHKAVPGMYEFITNNAERYVTNPQLAQRLKQEAANRELPGYSIAQELFSEMCRIWVEAYQNGHFPIDTPAITFPDTAPRFERVKQLGRKVGVMTSGSLDFVKLLYGAELQGGQKLAGLVDEYFLGEEIGDKDHPETHAKLWELTERGIYALFDDKMSVCRAADEGLKSAGGRAQIYLVDRKKNQNSPELLEEITARGIIKIATFNEVQD